MKAKKRQLFKIHELTVRIKNLNFISPILTSACCLKNLIQMVLVISKSFLFSFFGRNHRTKTFNCNSWQYHSACNISAYKAHSGPFEKIITLRTKKEMIIFQKWQQLGFPYTSCQNITIGIKNELNIHGTELIHTYKQPNCIFYVLLECILTVTLARLDMADADELFRWRPFKSIFLVNRNLLQRYRPNHLRHQQTVMLEKEPVKIVKNTFKVNDS